MICKSCVAKAESLKRWTKERMAKGLPVGRTRELDYKKIVELRDDGWSQKSIADHLSCSVGGVQNALRKMR